MKRIVVCCDGTWNDLDMRYITNVGRLVQCLGKNGKSGSKNIKQSVYYDDGVGAASGGVRKVIEGATGLGIDEQIYGAYRHICINYEPGDEICLFGFSRGAFAVRSVAGMIGLLGLVAPSNLKHLARAMDAYRDKNPTKQKAFKQTQASFKQVKITLLGCWDTVGSLGIPDKIPYFPLDNLFRKRYEFHNTDLGKHVERALHAVAIDERRKEFNVTMMHKAKGAPASQVLMQTWFPGDHGCVGGGSWEKRAFSNRSLQWMITSADQLGINLGINTKLLHDEAIADSGVFFSSDINWIYGKKNRTMPEACVSWSDIDSSVHQRWHELKEYRPWALKKRFATQLNELALDDVRQTPLEMTALAKGQSAFVRVAAANKHNASKVLVKPGETYQFEVNRLQVWKDGDLDPCDIRGWNTTKGAGAKPAYKDGDPIDPNKLKSALIKRAANKRMVKTSDWFELIVSCEKGNYKKLAIKVPALETEPYRIAYKATSEGELYFTANDLSHTLDVIDKYDNNSGWVWLKITRQ